MLFLKRPTGGAKAELGSNRPPTCSGAACWTVWAETPLVSGSSHCWSSCRCDFAAPARSACSSAARPSASSAPAPVWKTQEKSSAFTCTCPISKHTDLRCISPYLVICSAWWFWVVVAFFSVASQLGLTDFELDLCFFSVLPVGGEGVFVLPLRAFGEELLAIREALLPCSSWGRFSRVVANSSLPVPQWSSSLGSTSLDDDCRLFDSADLTSWAPFSDTLSTLRIWRQSTVCLSSWANTVPFWHWYWDDSGFVFHFEPVRTAGDRKKL